MLLYNEVGPMARGHQILLLFCDHTWPDANMNKSPESLRGKRIAQYIRVSSDKQDASRQTQSIAEWLERWGLSRSLEFKDTEGRNPRDRADKRLDFQRALKLAKAGLFDAIVVDSQDRFGVKDAYEWGMYITRLRECGVELWSVQQGLLSANDDYTILTTTLGSITSTKEQKEKAWRSLTKRQQISLQGAYPGGRPPYGMDVVCYSADGKEKYRVVWEGHQKRVKIAGSIRERYDGPNNTPKKDLSDTLRLRPSIIEIRLQWVRQIFEWAAAGLTDRMIADKLNDAGVDPVFAPKWYKTILRPLLKNPVYIGFPTDNKRAGSRHYEYVDGVVRPVERATGGRSRKKRDWWQPLERQFDPIVSPDLFNRVQETLASRAEAYRRTNAPPPQCVSMWLRGVLVCGRCGKTMHASASNKGRNVPSYFCSTYNQYGRNNPTGCRCHRVRAHVIDELVRKYLQESEKKTAGLIFAAINNDKSLVEPIEGELNQGRLEILELFAAIARRIEQASEEVGLPPTGAELSVVLPADEYDNLVDGGVDRTKLGLRVPDIRQFQILQEMRRPLIEQKLTELRGQHDDLVAKIVALPQGSLTAEKVRQKALEVEGEIERLESEAEDLVEKLEEILANLQARMSLFAEVNAKTSEDVDWIRKRELLRQVVARIVLHWRYAETRAANQPKSVLDRVEVYPESGGDPVCLKSATSPGLG